MKVILYTHDLSKIGGIETAFYNLSQYLTAKGYEVGVRYNRVAAMQIQRYREAGIDIKREQQEVCDILIIGSVYRRPRNIFGRVVVQQVHADWSDEFWNGADVAKKLIAKASLESDLFAGVSKSSSKFVADLVDTPVIVMNNLAPEQSEHIYNSGNKKLVIAAFTRMTSEKGLKNYEALRDRLKELKIDAELRVYTSGDAPDGWQAYEPVPDIRTEFPQIDFVASLADTESFGYTIAEANSCSIPVIIKRSNSTCEFFDDESNLIIDKVSDITEKDLYRKYKSNYKLREISEKSIDEGMKTIEKLVKKKVILKSNKTFYDVKAKKQRLAGEIFSVPTSRAKELLRNKIKLVQVL